MKVNYTDIGPLNDNDAATIYKTIVVPAKDALKQLRQAVTGNLTLRDNQYAAVITFGTSITPMTSGTEWTFANPLKTKPIGFTPINATDTSGSAIAFDSAKLNLSRTDGLLGITVRQDLLGGSGDIGEFVSAGVTAGAAITLTTNVNADITSMTVPAGTWGIEAIGMLDGTLTGTLFRCAVSLTSATLSTSGESDVQTPTVSSASADISLSINGYRIVLAAAAPVYLVTKALFSAGTAKAYGRINARRMVKVQNSMIVTGILWGG